MAVSEHLGRKVTVYEDVLLAHDQEIHPTTSFVRKCLELGFPAARRQTFRALKLIFVKRRGYEVYNTIEI